MSIQELISISSGFADIVKRLGTKSFEVAKVNSTPAGHIIDYIGSVDKELQILLNQDGNIVGINRAIYDDSCTELIEYQAIP